jgi:hypothetical protein
LCAACRRALARVSGFIKSTEPARQGCEYCSPDKYVEYQRTTTTQIFIKTVRGARALEVCSDHCPPFADCSAKGVSTRSLFLINYCPECGRDLRVKMDKEEQ